jgi:putative AlgH/UPF0301 family transcriptional regulator
LTNSYFSRWLKHVKTTKQSLDLCPASGFGHTSWETLQLRVELESGVWVRSQMSQGSIMDLGSILNHSQGATNLLGGDWNMFYDFPYIGKNHPN